MHGLAGVVRMVLLDQLNIPAVDATLRVGRCKGDALSNRESFANGSAWTALIVEGSHKDGLGFGVKANQLHLWCSLGRFGCCSALGCFGAGLGFFLAAHPGQTQHEKQQRTANGIESKHRLTPLGGTLSLAKIG